MRIAIVEDNFKIREELATFLEKYGYTVCCIDEFGRAVDAILEQTPDLVLLDINLPVFDGYYICRALRAKSRVPVIIVTSRSSELDELMSMNLGADDFITKPYNTQILLAHISSVLSRTYHTAVESPTYNGLTADPAKSTVSYQGQSAELTKNELRILQTLLHNKDAITPRDELMNALWQSDEFVDDNTLTVNMNRLRKKLEALGASDMIKTKRGQGYHL